MTARALAFDVATADVVQVSDFAHRGNEALRWSPVGSVYGTVPQVESVGKAESVEHDQLWD